MNLTPRYLERIGLCPQDLDAGPTLRNLAAIVEAHLEHIPFDNLAQHGARGGPATLDVDALAEKLLDRRRGGFCFELNGLLAEWLSELGYDVLRVPSYVHMGAGQDFRPEPTHMCLIVAVPGERAPRFFVDVGFGEPACRPLRYEPDVAQETPEGMVSRFVEREDHAVLEWFDHEANDFSPRLRFEARQAELPVEDGPALAHFDRYLQLVHRPESAFSRKLVVVRLTRERKLTVAGHRFKRTGPPRFGLESPKTVDELGSSHELRRVLEEVFGIPMAETEGLTMAKSRDAPQDLWGNK